MTAKKRKRLVERLWAVEIGMGKARWIARLGEWGEPTLFIRKRGHSIKEAVRQYAAFEPKIVRVEVRKVAPVRKPRKAVRK